MVMECIESLILYTYLLLYIYTVTDMIYIVTDMYMIPYTPWPCKNN